MPLQIIFFSIYIILLTDRPALSLPGNPKFASYKNTLQEYCQKRKGAVPQYSSESESDGSRWLIGKVSFLGHVCASEGPSDVAKDAEQRAAFAALKGLGYLDKDLEYKSASNPVSYTHLTLPTILLV